MSAYFQKQDSQLTLYTAFLQAFQTHHRRPKVRNTVLKPLLLSDVSATGQWNRRQNF